MIPGSNLLAIALSVIAKQKVAYYKAVSYTTNSAGYKTPVYAAPVDIEGSLQAVNTDYYSQMGLDMNKTYVKWFDPNSNVSEVNRNTSGDKIVFDGQTYIAQSSTDWKAIDKWRFTLFVKVLS